MRIDKMTMSVREAISDAAARAEKNGQQFVETEHIMAELLAKKDAPSRRILTAAGLDAAKVAKKFAEKADAFPKVERSSSSIELSRSAASFLRLAERTAEELGDSMVSSDALLIALSEEGGSAGVLAQAEGLAKAPVSAAINSERKGSSVDDESGEERRGMLRKFCVDLTEAAEKGKLDPVVGRDEEIRRTIQILQRRTKNNPVLIGEPGVGKTAVAEGLARRIVDGEVPEGLKGRRILALDMAALIAGAKFRGEFEERLKGVVEEVKKENGQVVLFIDEIHTLVGAGKTDGAMDAGNLLKPALARGELRCIGATTLDEYRLHMEKDAALERRFQKVLLEEPSAEATVEILRGLREKYELHHGVKITDAALSAATDLSKRYVADRFLPDKAIDLMDEAAAKIRMAMDSKPEEVEKREIRVTRLKIKAEALRGEKNKEAQVELAETESELREAEADYERLRSLWETEKSKVSDLSVLKERAEKLRAEANEASRDGRLQRVAEIQYSELPAAENAVSRADEETKNLTLVRTKVDAQEIAEIVSKATGIPVNKLSGGQRKDLMSLEQTLARKVVGQKDAIKTVSEAVRRAKAGVAEPDRPMASFLFLGPTGVGKTELAKSLAEEVFDGKDKMIRIDMTEYSESHSVARLIGSPPGYVGHEDGGQLTEAVRRRPYGVVLLDELEKAHPDVFDVLLQVLDEGRLTDGKGRSVDFSNTILVMTSNVGGGLISSASEKDSSATKALVEAELRTTFKPEFLNRIDETIFFGGLDSSSSKEIAQIHLSRLAERMRAEGFSLSFDDSIVSFLAKEGFDEQYGARPMRRAIRRFVENPMASEIISERLAKGRLLVKREGGETRFESVEEQLIV